MLRAAFAAFVLATGPVAAQAAGSLTLENPQLRVTVSGTTGAVLEVLRKESGTAFRNPAPGADGFRIRLPLDYWEKHGAAAGQAGRFRIREKSETSVTLEADRFSTTEMKAPLRVELRYRLDRDDLVAALRLENGSEHAVDRIVFPILEVSPATNGDEALVFPSGAVPLRLLFSNNKINVRHDPFPKLDPADLRAWFPVDPAVSAKAFRYPYPVGVGTPGLPTTWLLYRSDRGGIGWEVRDRDFQSQKAVVERKLVRDRYAQEDNRRTYELSWHWQPEVSPRETWESPEVRLKFNAGDWHELASQHRDWLKTWLKRPRVPARFQSSLGWISRGVPSFDAIPGFAQEGLDIGIPYFLVYGWFSGNMHTLSYGYFPRPELGGVESLRRNLEAARALGAYPLAWFNGTTSVETTAGHHDFGRDWIAVDRLGGMVLDGRWTLYGPDRPPNADDGSVNFNFDMGTGAAGYLKGIVRRLVEDYGFSGFEMDQGSKNYLSYSPYGEIDRPELEYSRGIARFYDEALQLVTANDPGGVILGELANDFIGQYVHSSWHFEGGELDVPSFTLFRYSLPWITLPVRAAVGDRAQANLAFMLNAPLDIFEYVDPASEYGSHLKRLGALKQRVHTFLYAGDFSDMQGFSLHGPDPGSAVAARSYVETGTRTAVVVVNTTGEPQAPVIDLGAGGGAVRYTLDGQVHAGLKSRGLELELEPYDVNVLVLEHGAEVDP